MMYLSYRTSLLKIGQHLLHIHLSSPLDFGKIARALLIQTGNKFSYTTVN